MPRLDALKKPWPVTVNFDHGGEKVIVTFDRNAMTQRWVKAVQDGIEAEDVMTTARCLAEILIEWNVEDDNGKVPIDQDVLADLPLGFLAALDQAIGQAATPTSEEGNASENISSTPSIDSFGTPDGHPSSPSRSESQTASGSIPGK